MIEICDGHGGVVARERAARQRHLGDELARVAEDHQAVVEVIVGSVSNGDDLRDPIAVEVAHRHAAVGFEVTRVARALGVARNRTLSFFPQHAAAEGEVVLTCLGAAAVDGPQRPMALVVCVAETGNTISGMSSSSINPSPLSSSRFATTGTALTCA